MNFISSLCFSVGMFFALGFLNPAPVIANNQIAPFLNAIYLITDCICFFVGFMFLEVEK